MNPPKFLLDEHLPPSIADELRRREPGLQVLVIGVPGAPRKGTLDPDILLWVEANGYLLVTNNRRSMPVHLTAHLTGGHHVPGIFDHIITAADRATSRGAAARLGRQPAG